MPELEDRRLEEIARLAALDIQCDREPRKLRLGPINTALVNIRVKELLERPPEPPFGLASPGVSPAGYIDEPLRKRLEKVAKAYDEAQSHADELREARDKVITDAVRKGVALRTVGRVTGLRHSTVQAIANRAEEKK